MTLIAVVEKETTTLDSLSIPVFVYDDAEAFITESAAVSAAAGEAATFTGFAAFDNFNTQRLSKHSFRVWILYQTRRLRPFPRAAPTLAVSNEQHNFSFVARPKTLAKSLSTLAKSPADAPDSKGLFHVSNEQLGGRPVTVHPAPATDSYEWIYPAAPLPAGVRDAIRGMLGAINSAAFLGNLAGTMQFVGCTGRKRAENETSLHLDFGYLPFANHDFGDGIALNNISGHVYVWSRVEGSWNDAKKVVVPKTYFAYAEQVWPTANFSSIT
jgi:hypothetical protein